MVKQPQNTLKKPRIPDLLLAIAQSAGTPTYVYEESVLRRQCQVLRRALDPVDARLLYAMKANSNPAVLGILTEEVDGLDAVSPAEVLLALRLGFDPARVLFSPNNPSDEEMETMFRTGVRLNLGEFSRLRWFAETFPGSEVCIRLNPQVGAGHHQHVVTGGEHSKFGIGAERVPDILALCRKTGLRIVGLHQHIGSGFTDDRVLRSAMEFLIETAATFRELRFINFGGGLGIGYRADDPSFDVLGFRERFGAFLASSGSERTKPLSYWFEPGRYLTAEAGTLLVKVTAVKRTSGGIFAGTDSGFNHLIRPILYGAYHEIYNLSNPDAPLEPVHVAGNICEAGDLFATNRPIQRIREGDVLAILDTGAYGISMASEYNLRPLPTEVMVAPDGSIHLVRERRSPEAFVDRFLEDHTPFRSADH